MRIFKVYWPLGLGVLALTAALLYFSYEWGYFPDYPTVFYGAQETAMMLACLIIPLLLLLIVRQTKRFLAFLCFFMLIGANIIACAALPGIVFHHNEINLGNLYLGDHVYHLETAITGILSDLNNDWVLWECDRSGWFCRIIYVQDYYGDYNDMAPKLTSDPKTNTLLFMVDDKIVYTHNP